MTSLDVLQVDGGLARHKTDAIVRAYPSLWAGVVIDVGCRTRELETALAGHGVRYLGVDIDPGAEIVADLGDELPFDDNAANVVTALDVLEHTDDIHRAFAELCRVASDHVVIALPNCFELRTRLHHLLHGRPWSEKYGLPVAKPADRHRWFFSLDEARHFVRTAAGAHGWRVVDERGVVGPRGRKIAPAIRRWPNLLSQKYLAVLSAR